MKKTYGRLMKRIIISKIYRSENTANKKLKRIARCGRGHGHKSKKTNNGDKKFYPLLEKAVEAKKRLELEHGEDLCLYRSIIEVRYTSKNGKLNNISMLGYFLTSRKSKNIII